MAPEPKHRPFTLEDARRLTVLRSYVTIIDKATADLCASDVDGTVYAEVVSALRDLTNRLEALRKAPHPNLISSFDCYDGYDLCPDGICRVWCS